MNKVILMGRLTRDAEITYTQNEKQTAIARFTIAVDRRFKRDGDSTADVIQCQAFGKSAEFFEKYTRKGTKLVITGRWQTGSYTNKDGQRVYTNTCIVEDQEFAESKATAQQHAEAASTQATSAPTETNDGFMSVNDGIAEDDLPFK